MAVLSAGVLIVALLLTCAGINTLEQDLIPTFVSKPCEEALSVEIVNPHRQSDGSLLADDGFLYQHGQYWEELSPENETIYRGCACVSNSCVRKCCPESHLYAESLTGKCTRRRDPLLDPFRPFYNVSNQADYSNIRILYGDPCKYLKYSLTESEVFHIHTNGTLFFTVQTENGESEEDQMVLPDQYCLEVKVNLDGPNKIIPFVCFPPEEEEEAMTPIRMATFVLYPLGMILSLPFLVATFVVYAIVPELRNLHGKSLMSHVTSLFFAYLFLAITQLGGNNLAQGYCVVSAFIIYFSFLASFFWLNVMCFDLWWTFSGFRPLRGSVRERDHKKFIVYSLYSWGSPLLLLIIALIMDLASVVPNHLIKPGFGITSCWFNGDAATWAYFYGPVAVILTANLIMFLTTAWKIIQLKKETAVLKGTDSKRHDDDENKQRFSLYLKLFIVMGVNWAMEVISMAVGGPDYIWYLTDIGNTLQGVLIFIIFVWKDKVRKLLLKQFNGGAADSKSRNSSSASRSTRVYSATTNASLKNTSSQGDFNMTPVSRFEGTSTVP